MSLFEDQFGREVLRRAAESVRAVLDVLREAKVGQFQRAVLNRKRGLALVLGSVYARYRLDKEDIWSSRSTSGSTVMQRKRGVAFVPGSV